jgi:hypothetical protein
LRYNTLVYNTEKGMKEWIVTNYTAYRKDPHYGDWIKDGNKEVCNKYLSVVFHNWDKTDIRLDQYIQSIQKSKFVEFGVIDFAWNRIEKAHQNHLQNDIVNFIINVDGGEILLHPNAL